MLSAVYVFNPHLKHKKQEASNDSVTLYCFYPTATNDAAVVTFIYLTLHSKATSTTCAELLQQKEFHHRSAATSLTIK